MKHLIYVGPVSELRGKSALVVGATFGGVLAQFDDCSAIDANGSLLGFGWHEFRTSDFEEQSHD
jgi:hypothetical protein